MSISIHKALDSTTPLPIDAIAISASARRYGIPKFRLSRLHVALLGGVLAVAGCAIDPSTADETVATTRDPLVLTTGQGWGRDANGVTTTLRVCWDANSILGVDPDLPMLQATVQRAVKSTWERNSRVSFTGWQVCSGGEQVTIVVVRGSTSYTEPFIGPHKFTYLDFAQCGPDPTAKADCLYRTAVHEFGHVLGFAHEQTRTDTPSSCTLRDTWDWAVTIAGGTYYGSWDLDSVMNYCNPIWNNDGRLSLTDQLGLQSAYGAPAVPSACQRASDRYGISAFVTWGFAPPDVQAWWTSNNCATAPASGDTCQRAADTYGISAGVTWGFAPPDVRTWWTSSGCQAHAVGPNACQRASDLFAIQPFVTWGFAPPDVQAWWASNSCDVAHVQPARTSTCQRISDLYGVDAFVTFGFAPADVRTFWIANGCNTHPGLISVRSVSP